MKKIKLILVIVVSFFISICNCFAEGIEVDKVCSMSGVFNYGDVNISDTKIYLYRIADMSNYAKFTYVDDFSDYDVDINSLKDTQWKDLANELSNYIDKNNIKYVNEVTTDSSGKFAFNNLNVGLYLLRADTKKINDYEYSSGPVLLSLPNYNEIDEVFMYDLSVFMKSEAKSLNVNKGSTTNVPNTYDPLYVYISLFVGGLVVFIICYICIRKKNKSKEK